MTNSLFKTLLQLKEEIREVRDCHWNLVNPPPALGKLRMDWKALAALEKLVGTDGGVSSICKGFSNCGEGVRVGVLISTAAASCLMLPVWSRGLPKATEGLSDRNVLGLMLRRRLSSRKRMMLKRKTRAKEVVRM